jgi:hypothetical protein
LTIFLAQKLSTPRLIIYQRVEWKSYKPQKLNIILNILAIFLAHKFSNLMHAIYQC